MVPGGWCRAAVKLTGRNGIFNLPTVAHPIRNNHPTGAKSTSLVTAVYNRTPALTPLNTPILPHPPQDRYNCVCPSLVISHWSLVLDSPAALIAPRNNESTE